MKDDREPLGALPPISAAAMTPMFRQWSDVKRRHPDTLVFFRMGDFYELFFEDAEQAAPVLEIALTARGKGTATSAPMCGVPHHALNNYLARLVERGFRVAICEQLEDPRKVKGMVKRDVVRVVSPGTFTDAERLDPATGNFLAAIAGLPPGPFGITLCDLSTGGLILARAAGEAELADLLSRYGVREVLLPETSARSIAPLLPEIGSARPLVTRAAEHRFHAGGAARQVQELLQVNSLAGFGCPEDHPALPAAAALLDHLTETQRVRPAHLDRLRVEDPRATLALDYSTRRNLELVANLRDGSKNHTLLEVLDRTRTPLGARTLRGWILEPLAGLGPLTERLGLVDGLFHAGEVRRQLREALGQVRDLERLLSRAALGSATPHDLLALLRSLEAVPAAATAAQQIPGLAAERLALTLDPVEDLVELLARALVDEPSATVGEGRVLRPGFDPVLDEARDLAQGGKRLIAEIENRERQRTGISSLKVRFNRVFGYFLEVSKSNLSRVPADWERRQTVATGERFVTHEIRELESRILSAEERLGERETELFRGLLEEITARAGRIRNTAAALAELDAAQSMAEVAVREGYVRPEIEETDLLAITDGRHPVVERLLPPGRFVPNDCKLDEQQRILVVTGPNMGGKSTYLRQVALTVLMAQAGSFVPAGSSRIGLVDRIFCRVGASDNLAGGESTFMVEMTETANILHNATPRSLVILDEIGRGTATWDGMAIAWAVVEALHDDPRLSPKALFATHYHELTELAGTLPRLANVHIAVREHGHEVIFLHRVEPGPTDRSYGIQVARLAGLPDRVIVRAREILDHLVSEHPVPSSGQANGRPTQLALFGPEPRDREEEEILARLRKTDPEEITPRQAHELLREWRNRLV